MSQSLSKLYIHIVFHVKNNAILIREKDKHRLYAYMGSIIKSNESIPIVVNGVGDHVHILCIMSKNIALAKLVENIKRHSSRWIKTIDNYYQEFAWQGGYGGFSVSSSIHDIVKRYIENQEKHHKKTNFKEEYLKFLKEYDIDYNENYLWND
jgi:REP element-mobilizing transposase RayT